MRKIVLITGCSSGFGMISAARLSSLGYTVYASMRDLSKNNDLKIELDRRDTNCHMIELDVRDDTSIQKTINTITDNEGKLDILINNAGYGIATPFHVTSIEDEENFIRVLGTSVITLTKLFVKDMIKQKSGKIMIVSSVAAFAPPSAIQVLYGPIKTFMNRFSDAMNSSYNRLGITSTALCPGFTLTNFHTASNVQEMMNAVPSFMKFSAERIAKEGVEAMFKGKSLCVPTKTYRFLVFLLRVTPNSFIRLLENVLAPGRYEQK